MTHCIVGTGGNYATYKWFAMEHESDMDLVYKNEVMGFLRLLYKKKENTLTGQFL